MHKSFFRSNFITLFSLTSKVVDSVVSFSVYYVELFTTNVPFSSLFTHFDQFIHKNSLEKKELTNASLLSLGMNKLKLEIHGFAERKSQMKKVKFTSTYYTIKVDVSG